MDDVPVSPPNNSSSPVVNDAGIFPQAVSPAQPVSGVSGKEIEGNIAISTELPFQDIGKEMELPKEVVGAGVKSQPLNVPIPPLVKQMGVKSTGGNVTVTTTVQSVPLTYDQINQGLKQSITSSWHWLSAWCVRRLKQLRLTK